ncbi:MAG: DUF2029 domain-containing protein [Planctomycetes bacterium]|nr:DUF2029 domain-containing protein [Planctomycetota bacterium]
MADSSDNVLVSIFERHSKIVVVLLALYACWMIAKPLSKGQISGDFRGIRVAAGRLAGGERVFFPQLEAKDEMPNKHGLVFLVLMRPFAALPEGIAQALWVALSFVLLAHAMFLLSRMVALSHGAVLLALVLVAPFAHLLVKYSQTGFFMLWVLVLGAYFCRSRRSLAGGALFGIATAIKLFPIVFLPWALWTGRGRVAVGFVIGLAASFALPSAVHGFETTRSHMRDYVAMLREDTAASSHHPFHQSLRPLVLASIAPHYDVGIASEEDAIEAKRFDGVRNFAYDDRLWRSKEVVVGIFTLLFVLLCAWAIPPWFSGRSSRRSSELLDDAIAAEVGLVLSVMVLVSPLAWKHYYVWCLPMLVVLLDLAANRRTGRGTRFWSRVAIIAFFVALTVPHKGLIGVRLAEWYAVFQGYAVGLAFFCILAAVAVRSSYAERSAGEDVTDDLSTAVS